MYRPGGSTTTSDRKSTPASDASTPNKATSVTAANEHPPPHEEPSARAEPLVELCSELRDIRKRSAVDGSDRNRTAEAAGPEGAA